MSFHFNSGLLGIFTIYCLFFIRFNSDTDKMQKLSKVQMAQVAVAALVFCLSVAIMGTAGHSLQVYRGQSSTNPWWLPLWNQHFNVRGTNSLIGSSAFSTVTTLVFIALCFVPKVSNAHHQKEEKDGGDATLCSLTTTMVRNTKTPESV